MNTNVFRVKTSTKLLSLCLVVLFIIMASSISEALMHGDFWPEVSQMTAVNWGKVTVIDLYIGLVLFASWAFWRENHLSRGLFWAVLIVLLGNLVSCIYLLLALYESSDEPANIFSRKRG